MSKLKISQNVRGGWRDGAPRPVELCMRAVAGPGRGACQNAGALCDECFKHSHWKEGRRSVKHALGLGSKKG